MRQQNHPYPIHLAASLGGSEPDATSPSVSPLYAPGLAPRGRGKSRAGAAGPRPRSAPLLAPGPAAPTPRRRAAAGRARPPNRRERLGRRRPPSGFWGEFCTIWVLQSASSPPSRSSFMNCPQFPLCSPAFLFQPQKKKKKAKKETKKSTKPRTSSSSFSRPFDKRRCFTFFCACAHVSVCVCVCLLPPLSLMGPWSLFYTKATQVDVFLNGLILSPCLMICRVIY